MRLELIEHRIKDISFSGSTYIADSVLYISKSEILALIQSVGPFIDVEIDVAHPGDRTRIINILDVIEPRHKSSGSGTVFPGVIGPPTTVGQGVDHSLKGVAVITTGDHVPGESVHWRDGIIDMWGTGACYTPFSNTLNIVLRLKGKEVFTKAERSQQDRIDYIDGSDYARWYNRAARAAGFKVADYLASMAKDVACSKSQLMEIGSVSSHLPRVVFVCQLHRDRWLYGDRMGWQPTFIHPNEMLDGAVFSSFMGPASSRDCSYIYQNHPLIFDMYRRHGIDLNFSGVLLWFYGPLSVMEKDRIGGYATKLLRMINAEGAVMTWAGDGQSGIDVMMMCQKFEQAGIKTAVLSPEMAKTPDDPGFVHYVNEANAIVSTGNYEMNVDLGIPSKVFGGTHLSVPNIDAADHLCLPLRYLYDAVSPQGYSRLCGTQL